MFLVADVSSSNMHIRAMHGPSLLITATCVYEEGGSVQDREGCQYREQKGCRGWMRKGEGKMEGWTEVGSEARACVDATVPSRALLWWSCCSVLLLY